MAILIKRENDSDHVSQGKTHYKLATTQCGDENQWMEWGTLFSDKYI